EDDLVNLSSLPVLMPELLESSWHFDLPSDHDFLCRLLSIRDLIVLGHCEAAFKLICDLATENRLADAGAGKWDACFADEAEAQFIRGIALLAAQPEERRFKAMLGALSSIDELLAKRSRFAIQLGRMMLRELLKTEGNVDLEGEGGTLPDEHVKVFKAI